MKKAAIIGANGQDGRLLADLLKEREYFVLPVTREVLDIYSSPEVSAWIASERPDELYYLAAYHHSSQDAPVGGDLPLFELSYRTHVLGLIHFLEAIRETNLKTKVFYAASSLAFGNGRSALCDEATPLEPVNPYGISKAMGVQVCRYYRNQYRVFVSAGLLFNHESGLRQEKFLSKKITSCVKRILAGHNEKLTLGDLSAEADWGYAPDYVDAMNRILLLGEADDFVVATGIKHSVQEFVQSAFGQAGLSWEKHVSENSAVLKRRNAPLIGDPMKLNRATGWAPTVDFHGMIRKLLD